MAIHAQSSCTLSTITDVEAVYTYYYLSDSTITIDEAPKDGVNPPGASSITIINDGNSYTWQITEPELNIQDDVIQTAVGKLYYIECVEFSDGTYDWGPLMTSSTYAAAKAAYNLSSQALAQAQAANEATALLGGHFIYNSTWETSNTPHSANVVQTVTKNGIDVTSDPTKWDYNVHIGANGIRLRNNESVLSEWTSTALKFNNPSNGNAQLIIGANGTLQSGNYVRGDNSDSKFATTGTRIDLTNGDIITQYFRVSQGLEQGINAGAYIHGTIEALDGKIGTDSTNYWEIGNSTDYNLHNTAKMIGHGSSFIQLGDDNTWRLATNRIHTGWYTTSNSLLHYPSIDSKYWDFGIHAPTTATDKFLYIRKAKDGATLTTLLYDIDDTYTTPQWDYKFWIDGEGKVHAPGFYIGDSTTPIGGGAGTVAEKLLHGAGSTIKPVYFRTDSGHEGELAEISYTIEQSVPSESIWIKQVTTTGNGNAVTNISFDSSSSKLTATKGATYLTSYTETDPTVPSWAKASTKPSYSYSEINGTVPQSALPSYVDDVLEYSGQSSFPTTGESGKIYVDTSTNKTYRWSGTTYVEISSSLALGETSSTAYRGDRGKIAYSHAIDSNRLTTAQNSGFYKFSVTAEGHIGSVTEVTANDIPSITKSKISDFPTTWALSNITGADDLKAIEGLSGTNGLLRKTANNTWELDTNNYLTEESDPIFSASAASGITSSDITNWNSKTSNVGTVTSVRVQATSPVQSSQSTAQSTTLNTTISLANGYGDTKNPYGSKTARYVLAAPANTDGVPNFRALTNADVGLGNVLNYTQVTAIGQGENGTLRVWTGNPSSTSTDDYDDIQITITAYEQSSVAKAEALNLSAAVGSTTIPVYFKADGKPYAIDYTINADVPSGALFTDTTYTFANGTNSFTVTPKGGTAQTVTITPSITNNVTGTGTSGRLAQWNGDHTLTNGPSFTTGGTGYLKQDGTWGTPGGTYSLPTATYNTLGGLKPWFSTTGASTLASGSAGTNTSTPSINARSTTAGKYYAVETDKNGRLFVNVPWEDTDNDTLNTAGSTDTSSKIFLIGATSQVANSQTYSHDTAYVGTNGHLYSASKEVLVGGSNASSSVTITPSTTSVYSMTSAGSVTAGKAASFTAGTFTAGSLTMAPASTTAAVTTLNITFTAPSHTADSFTTNTPTVVTLPGRSSEIKAWTGYTAATAAAQTFTGKTS